jgi:membrane-associated phospholipid phosphatase
MSSRPPASADWTITGRPRTCCTLAGRSRTLSARVATEVLAPAPVATALLTLVAWRTAPTPADAARWALVGVACGTLVPLACIELGVRRGRLSDRHLTRREERVWPFLVGLVAVLGALGWLTLAQASRPLLALLVTMALVLVVSLVATTVCKISMHAAAIAAAAVVIAIVFGWPSVLLAPALALVGWARLELHEHTPAQVLSGMSLGAGGAAVVYALLA